jgi:hypothetical protein
MEGYCLSRDIAGLQCSRANEYMVLILALSFLFCCSLVGYLRMEGNSRLRWTFGARLIGQRQDLSLSGLVNWHPSGDRHSSLF